MIVEASLNRISLKTPKGKIYLVFKDIDVGKIVLTEETKNKIENLIDGKFGRNFLYFNSTEQHINWIKLISSEFFLKKGFELDRVSMYGVNMPTQINYFYFCFIGNVK